MKSIKRKHIPVAILAAGIIFTAANFFGEKATAKILEQTDFCLSVAVMDKTYEFHYPEIDFSEGRLYLKNAEEVVDGIYYDTLTSAVNADLECFPEREFPFVYKSEKVGLGVDKTALLRKIERALDEKTANVSADKFVEVLPKVTEAELRETTKKRGEFSTSYASSQQKRKSNVKLASSLISFYELDAGAEFSFNEAIGKRTEERGFTTAKVIENGKFVEGVGGGVCQVSSTVYNCALLSGLSVTERHRHSLAVSYVEPSFDAMVSYGYADLKFQNDTSSPVYIVTYADGNEITVRIYGEENCCRYERISLVNQLIEPLSEEIVYTEELADGEKKAMVIPKYGIKSAGFIEVYRNDKLIERRMLGTDEYSPLRGITLVGRKRNNDFAT